MAFTWDFIRTFAIGLFYTAPVLITLLLVIVVLGHFIGKLEGWSSLDALYHSFITATTVGYGDMHPTKKLSKVLAVVIAFVGLVFNGIVVSVAIRSAVHAFDQTHVLPSSVKQASDANAQERGRVLHRPRLDREASGGGPDLYLTAEYDGVGDLVTFVADAD